MSKKTRERILAAYAVIFFGVITEGALLAIGWHHWTSIIGTVILGGLFLYSTEKLQE